MKIERICILVARLCRTQLVSQLAARASWCAYSPTAGDGQGTDPAAHGGSDRGRRARSAGTHPSLPRHGCVINLVGILHESKVGRVDLPSARRGDFQKVHIELPRKVIMPAANPACVACCT